MFIETPATSVSKNGQETFDFLIDLANFEKLMPENIAKFEVLDADKFLFALKGMPEIVLERKEQVPNSKLVLGAVNDKLPFTLTADISEMNENTSKVVLSFQGEFNAMMAMMVKTPIANFMNTLSQNLGKL
ncbi:SRPBCC family protein [Maribacter sp. 2304DJ31-5]|uniref:SRPBCC family protein n=1 Tax=Maribacter sp. 2304DJ31-5 TaxID=3386273 RepID=UPI0039BC74C9